jgi:hypothetical protein
MACVKNKNQPDRATLEITAAEADYMGEGSLLTIVHAA